MVTEWSHGLYNNIAHRWQSVSSLPSIMTDAHRLHLALTLLSSFPKIRVLCSLYPTSVAYPENIVISLTPAKQNKGKIDTQFALALDQLPPFPQP
jgi:hypothetical protein